jgi:hypothetical protein
MTQQAPSPTESIEIIKRMIEGSKARLNENGFIYLFWGWLILVCALAQFVLLQAELYAYNYYPYFLVIPAGIYTGISEARKHRNSQGSYIHKLMAALWIPLGFNLAIVGFFSGPVIGISPTPFLLIFLAIGATVSGGALRFPALIWGGIICNLVGFAAFLTPSLYQPLLLGAGIIAADLVPGYMLRKKFQMNHG